MKTSEFITKVEKFKEEVDSKDSFYKTDILKLLNYYIKLSILDYSYLNTAYQTRKYRGFKGLNHSSEILNKMYNGSSEIGNNLSKSQNMLREIKNKIGSSEQEFFKKVKLDYLFQYIDMMSYSGTAIVGNAFIDYMNKNIAVYYDKYYKDEVYKEDIETLEELYKEKGEDNKYFYPVNEGKINFKLGNMTYKYTGISEGNRVMDIVYGIYKKNTRKRKTKTKKLIST